MELSGKARGAKGATLSMRVGFNVDTATGRVSVPRIEQEVVVTF